jgi:hypothetical protein
MTAIADRRGGPADDVKRERDIRAPSISVKLSALHPRFEPAKSAGNRNSRRLC